MQELRQERSGRVWLRWLLANAASLTIVATLVAGGYAASQASAGMHAFAPLPLPTSTWLALAAIPVAAIGVLQWHLFGRYRRYRRPWGEATVVGLLAGAVALGALAGTIEWLAARGLPRETISAIWAGVLATGVGIAQQRVLRRHFLRTSWWGATSALGGIVAGLVLATLGRLFPAESGMAAAQIAAMATAGCASGIVYGAITGFALMRLRQPARPAV